MTTKLEKVAKKLNDEYRDVLKNEMLKRFSVEIETGFNLFSGEIYSNRIDGQDFTPEQKTFAEQFEAGFVAAMMMVRKEIN